MTIAASLLRASSDARKPGLRGFLLAEFEQFVHVRDELIELTLAHRRAVVQVAEHPRQHHLLAVHAFVQGIRGLGKVVRAQ